MLLNKKIVAFDMDGTLTESKQHLEELMSNALRDLLKQKKVAIITGGSYGQFQKQFLPYFNVSDSDKDLIYNNLILLPVSGSQRYEFDKEKNDWVMTDMEKFPEELRNKTLAVLNGIIESGHYDIGAVIKGDEIIEDRGTQITLSALGQHAPLEAKKVWDPDEAKRQVMKLEIEAQLPDVSVSIGGGTSVDILPKGFNKAKGLIRLLDKLGMTINDMVFVGDAVFPGGNDYSAYEAGIESVKVAGPDETIKLINSWIS